MPTIPGLNTLIDYKQQKRLIHTRKVLILDYPFWGALALRLILKEDTSCQTGWTDSITHGYNPYWIKTLLDQELLFHVAHEVTHCMCQHPTRLAGRNKKSYNLAADFVANSILDKAGFIIPQGRPYDPRFDGMSLDEVYVILEKEYEERKKERQKKKQQEKNKQKNKDKGEKGDSEDQKESGNDLSDGSPDDSGNPVDNEQDIGDNGDNKDSDTDGNSDGDNREKNDREKDDGEKDDGEKDDNSDELDDNKPDNDDDDDDNDDDDDELEGEDPGNCGEVREYQGKDGTSASPSDIKEQEQDWKIATVQAATQANQYGNMPAGLGAEIQNIVEPKVDPRDLLQDFVARTAKNDFSWTPPNRKYIQQGLYMPSPKSEELGTVVQVLDTSISVSQVELDNFSAIVAATLEAYSFDAIVLYCDTKVYEPEYFTQADLPLKLKLQGRGGTDFIPPFNWIRKNDIDPVCLIYLTDLQCNSFPSPSPDYPVVWICTDPPSMHGPGGYWHTPPFGEVIFIDLAEEKKGRFGRR